VGALDRLHRAERRGRLVERDRERELERAAQPLERRRAEPAVVGDSGGDQRMRDLMFRGGEDPLGQRAGSRAGAMSVLIGIAALKSSREGRRIPIAELGDIG
jgi:hypothetical protein